MPGDYSRNTHDPAKHYTRVLIQEGRVQLDSDANEASANLLHRITAETRDVIGETGAPKYGGGFAVAKTADGSDLTLSPGNLYVHGILVENDGTSVTVPVTAGDTTITMPRLILDGRPIEKDQWLQVGTQVTKVTNVDPETSTVTIAGAVAATAKAGIRRAVSFLTQPFGPGQTPADGLYSVYLKVWEREVRALEDPDIREIALGGPDTACRQQTVWQAGLRALDGDADCENAARRLAAAFPPPTGLLAAQTAPQEPNTDPCHLPPNAGYRGLENNLYRIEIHRGGELPNGDPTKRPTFKWARSNASLEVSVESSNLKDLKVRELGKDDLFRFEPNEWVELADDTSRRGDPHPLRQIDTIDAAKRLIKLKANAPATAGEHVILRRWSHGGTADENAIVVDDNDWIDLEFGVQVRFAGGVYHAGDYWEVPARTAIQDVLWPRYDASTPEHLPPRGIPRYYTALAVVTVAGGKFDRVIDCRTLFPPLTHICADDVCFDNKNCKLPGAKTVQQALDELCARDDFDFYKKHLFGYGVVCGLQLGCTGAAQKSVLVKSGYAIDCEGRDIKVRKDVSIDLTKLPEWAALANETSVCLSVERGNGEPAFHLSKKKKEHFLAGSALMEAYEECFQKIADYFADNFKPDTKPGAPVSDGQKRLTTAWNLIVQLHNPTTGRRVWISEEEHKLLETIYKELTELLKISNTYCALGAVPPFPKYPFDGPPARTWFGKSDHKRVRISPNGDRAFLFGANERIDVFERATNAMTDQLVFPNKVTLRDVAVSNDGSRLYAVSGDTIATYDSDAKKWSAALPLKGDKVGMLAVDSGGVELYAAGEKGLWSVNHATGAMQLRADITPGGHLAIDQRSRRIVASERKNKSLPFGTYDTMAVFVIESAGRLVLENTFPLPATGTDGVAISSDEDRREIDAYGVFDDKTGTKHILAVDRIENPVDIDLGVDGAIAVHGISGQKGPMAAVTLAGTNQLRFITMNEKRERELDLKIVPAQICPSSVAVASNGHIYAANHASRTITFYEPKVIVDPKPIDLDDLRKYREAAMEAFKDLFLLLTQSLKDCLCDHLLIDCPQCTKDDVVYLGCLELDPDRNVRKICPLEQRQFVLSPRLIGHWLSFVPVFPAIRALVEWFCCLDLPRLFEDRIPIPKDGEPDSITCAAMPKFSAFTKASVTKPIRDAVNSVRKRAPFLFDIFMEQDTASPKFNAAEIKNLSVATARARLDSFGVSVAGVEPFDAAKGFTHFRRALTDLQPGQSVVLVEQDGKVAYAHERVTASAFSLLAKPQVDPDTLRENVAREVARAVEERDQTIRGLSEQVGKLQEELTAAKKSREEADTRIATLSKRADAIDELKEAVAKLQRRPPKPQ